MTAERLFAPRFLGNLFAPNLRTQRHGLIAVAAACALHALLLMALQKNAPQTQSDALTTPSSKRLQWRWIPAATAPVRSTTSASPAQTRQDSTSTRTAIPPATTPATPPAISRPAGATHHPHRQQAEPSELPNQASVPASLAPAPTQADAPLQLQLPASATGWAAPRSMRSHALNDARSNTRGNTLEDRISQVTTGNDGLQVDALGEGRKRVRMNGRCVDVRQARIAQIDPMNEVSSRAASAVKSCD